MLMLLPYFYFSASKTKTNTYQVRLESQPVRSSPYSNKLFARYIFKMISKANLPEGKECDPSSKWSVSLARKIPLLSKACLTRMTIKSCGGVAMLEALQVKLVFSYNK